MKEQLSASILIPNYNGKQLLSKCLPSVLEACRIDPKNHEVIVIDMGSTDGSVSFLRKCFSDVKIVELQNAWLPEAFNAGLKISRNEIIIILDNDSIVDKRFLSPLLKHFTLPKLFAVHAKLLQWDKRTIDGGKRQGAIRFGLFEAFGEHEGERDFGQIDTVSPVLVAEHGAFRKKVLIELGGFDPLFPLYMQRIDVCYRAWKKGYFTIFEPRSLEYHRFSSRFASKEKKRFPHSQRFYQCLQEKESFIFMWKNFTDLGLLIEHIFFLPAYLLLYMFAKNDPLIFRSFISAFREMPNIVKWRIQDHSFLRSDEEVFQLLNLPFRLMKIPKKYASKMPYVVAKLFSL